MASALTMIQFASKVISHVQDHGVRQTLRLSRSVLHKRMNSRRIAQAKQRRSDYSYNPDPDVTVIVQFFNSKPNIPELAAALQQEAVDELIVIDDGSVDGSTKKWSHVLDHPNEFLLRAHDIHEVRTYDKALRMANGNLVCLTQDDDIPPQSNDWVKNAKTLFNADEQLLILGGFGGLNVNPRDTTAGEIHSYDSVKSPTERHSGASIPFEYVMAVNRPPMWVRREEFLEQGGIDQTFAPFQCDDVDACMRAWMNGYRVGLYNPDFNRDVDAGGMYHFNSENIEPQVRKNWDEIYERYGGLLENKSLQNHVKRANSGLTN